MVWNAPILSIMFLNLSRIMGTGRRKLKNGKKKNISHDHLGELIGAYFLSSLRQYGPISLAPNHVIYLFYIQ